MKVKIVNKYSGEVENQMALWGDKVIYVSENGEHWCVVDKEDYEISITD